MKLPVQNACTIVRENMIFWSDAFSSTCKTTEASNANNSNENRNKSCRDYDGTMAHGYNNQLPAKLNRWSDKGDYAP